jgi:pimeloyl-ACP methyl ester carboxylesterase
MRPTAGRLSWLLLAGRLANRLVGLAMRAIVKDSATPPPWMLEEFTCEARDARGGIAYGRDNQATRGRHSMLNDITDRVHEIVAPCLLLLGADDPIVDPNGKATAPPHVRATRFVADCGHLAQLEANTASLSKLQRYSPTGRLPGGLA